MKFGPVPLDRAEGAILAHSERLPDGRLRKGHVIGPEDIARLRAAGFDAVTVAELEPQYVHEDAAALRLAQALHDGASGMHLSAPFTGRVNLVADGPGVVLIDADRITAANLLDPMITVATVAPFHQVHAGGMIATNVLRIDEAYQAVSWPTVFLLAGLIPLGEAVQNTGTAAWIAEQILTLLHGWPIWSLQAGVALLATAFTLVMSNVGATVLLVPLAVSIAMAAGADPAIFALTVAISTSNSFLIPTHQVNALIMGPAGYKVMDFVKSGGIMTVLFLVVSLLMMNVVH